MSTYAEYAVPPLPTVPPPPSAAPGARVIDVAMFDTVDGGEIAILNGTVVLSDGLDTAAYLSLFGGNEDDSGLAADDAQQWWGNLSERNINQRYRSQTQYVLRSLPAITGNLRRVEDAAKADLAWFVSTGVASAVTAAASMPGRNQLKLSIVITIDGELQTSAITVPWGKP